MSQVEPTTKITEPIPAIVRAGRPAKTINGHAPVSKTSLIPLFFFDDTQIPNKTELTGIQKDVFLDRYSLRDEEGNSVEQYPEQMWLRVAYALASIEKTPDLQEQWSKKFYGVLKDFKFVPGGRILSGAGTGYQVTFYNCYVIPSPKDSRDGIMDNIKMTVEIQARAGGVGINLSSLRPRGTRVRKVNGTSSGPVNWAALYSTANHDVIQQGGSRRGALMLMLNDWHPDIEEFINVKQDLTKIPGANLSLCVSDAFMEAVFNDRDWELVFPDLSDIEYDECWDGDLDKWKSLGKAVKSYKTVKAREIWKQISLAAWRSAEPGVVFIDRYNKQSNTWYFEKIICTNPCGEQGLGAWAVCNLGSMNLVPYVKERKFDFELFAQDVKVAMRMLDNTIDGNYYFYEENKKCQMDIRRTGLGIMGLADAMILMQMRYGSDESIKFTEDVYKAMRDASYEASIENAKEKGPFIKFDREKYLQGQFIQRLPQTLQDNISHYGIRNAVILTQAPTGTTSILAGVNSGIEPVFEFTYQRKDRTGTHLVEHTLLKKWREENPESAIPDYFVSSSGLTPEEHVKVQAAAQKYIDSSISKTVNAPESYTVEDVDRLYSLAYQLGCKGITFFRDGSRSGVLSKVESEKKTEKPMSNGHAELEVAQLRSRPEKLAGVTYRVNTPVGHAFITINSTPEGQPFELFIAVGHAGSEVAADAEALGRLISMSFRIASHLSPKEIALQVVDQLKGIGGANPIGFGLNRVKSLADAVAKVLEDHIKVVVTSANNETKQQNSNGHVQVMLEQNSSFQFPLPLTAKKDLCPSCGAAAFVLEEGCAKCYACGYSKC